MPRNGSGVFIRGNGSFTGASTWTDQANSADKTISAPRHDTHDQDIADGLTGSVPRDGQAGMTGDLPMGGNRITGLGAGTTRDDAASIAQIQDETVNYLGTLAGTGDYTASTTPALTAYAAGQRFTGIVATTNTGNVTLKIGALDAKPVRLPGALEVPASAFVANTAYTFVYDGAQFTVYLAVGISGAQSMTGPLTIDAPAGAAELRFNQGGVNNGSVFASGGGGTDVTVSAGRFVVLSAGNETRVLSGDFNVQAGVYVEQGERVYSPNNRPYAFACLFDGTQTGTFSPTSGSNVTNITRASVGNYTINLTSAIGSNAIIQISGRRNAGGTISAGPQVWQTSTTAVEARTYATDSTFLDWLEVSVIGWNI